MNILVVDDSTPIRNHLVETLSTLDGVGRVDAAAHTSEARQAIQSAWPDLVILDIHMPRGSGLAVLQALQTENRPVTTIVLTNYPTWRDVCLGSGADFLFDKSSELQQAIDVVARLAQGGAVPGRHLPFCWECFERLPIPTWVFDVDALEFLAVNEAAVSRYGFSREEFPLTMAEIRPPEGVDALMEQIERRRGGAVIPTLGTRQHRAKDGSIVHVEVAVTPLDSAGRRLDLVMAHDIGERVAAEEALRASEARYRDLFENAADAIFTTDLDLNFTAFNRAAEALTGYTRKEAKAFNIASIVTPETLQVVKRRLAEQRNGRLPSVYETEILARDGRCVPIEVTARLLLREGVPVGTQGIARDITERRRLEQELRQAHKMEAIGRLAGGVAHDFNNLLTVIIGLSQEMLNGLLPGDPIHGDIVQVLNAGQHAADLARQLLAFSRQQMLAPRVLDLNAIVSAVIPMLRRLIGEDIDLAIRTGTDLFAIRADQCQLEQVIMNLMINARDAMPDGGTLTLETRNAEFDTTDAADRPGLQPGQYVQLIVSDTGHGMDADARTHLFEPFFTTKDGGRGTGLGLSTVYGIVKQSGGCIFVESEPGRGATLRVCFPRAVGEIESKPAMPVAPDSAHGTESILIVDDDTGVRDFVKRALGAHGYRMMAASSTDEVQRLCDGSTSDVDLLVTDVVMRGMNGRALADVLRERYPRMKVIFMSGYTVEGVVDRGEHDPSVAFVAKPFTRSVLAAKVREVLDASE